MWSLLPPQVPGDEPLGVGSCCRLLVVLLLRRTTSACSACSCVHRHVHVDKGRCIWAHEVV